MPAFPFAMPVAGLEAEFKVFIDEREIIPEDYWRTPRAFITRPLLARGMKSSQLPTGGAVYFDGGVLEVVTPVIEIAPQCTARMVRSLWEQIGFVRDQLDAWERHHAKRVRLQAFSCHFNISFEIARQERTRDRTIQKLALLLAHLLPIPVIVMGANRRSTGLGVRPRRDRIEITFDFTPDPGLMAATTALIVGVIRETITWPSYRVEELFARGIPTIAGLEPGRHATRNGWITRAFHFPRDPFRTPLDARVWPVSDGRIVSMRELALEIASAFRPSIRRVSDPFSERVLFAVLTAKARSLLELEERPAEYDDVGRAVRWGTTIAAMRNYEAGRRREDVERLAPPWRHSGIDRRTRVTLPPRIERRTTRDRRHAIHRDVEPRLSRSAYERVFRQLASGKRLRIGREILTPIGVKGWDHALFRTAGGEERMLSIDEVLEHMDGWMV